MILILSESGDESTSGVIEWLSYYNQSVCRINTGDQLSIDRLNLTNDSNETSLMLNGSKVDFDSVEKVWFRRGEFTFNKGNVKIANEYFNRRLHKHLGVENKAVDGYLSLILAKRPHIGNREYSVNKLEVLKTAKECGITIPESYIITTKSDLLAIVENSYSDFVSKSIQQGAFIPLENDVIINYTTELDTKIDQVEGNFFPSLVQRKLDKKFELRIFYLNKKFYSMAIFSQDNPQTKVDFRKYDNESPNRKVPFKLPTSIEDKIIELMERLRLTTGSIDMVYTIEKEYVFLEVNPVGQYEMVSAPCNYQLNKVIAKELVKQ